MRRMLAGLAGLALGLSVSTSSFGGDHTNPAVPDVKKAATPAADKVYIGVLVQVLTPQLATAFGLDAPKGALVSQVRPDGPAAVAGILPGDVILAFGNDSVDSPEHLHALVQKAPAGIGVLVRLWRKRAETTTTVIVESKAPENSAGEREDH